VDQSQTGVLVPSALEHCVDTAMGLGAWHALLGFVTNSTGRCEKGARKSEEDEDAEAGGEAKRPWGRRC
jgi:hypothetical protein